MTTCGIGEELLMNFIQTSVEVRPIFDKFT